MTTGEPRPCWQNCCGADDEEVRLIDAMEDSLAPWDEPTIQIRRLITLFEGCYHEADKEAEFIAAAIGTGACPRRSNERPPRRQRELENARRILTAWRDNPTVRTVDGRAGDLAAAELLGFLGEPTDLKVWQVARVVDRISQALDSSHPYHNLVLGVGEHGEPGTGDMGEQYREERAFLQRTRETILHDTVDGRESKVSLAYAIDLLMPCGWDFVGSLGTIAKAIGGDLHSDRPLACCARNLKRSPLCGRLRMISDTLHAYWGSRPEQGIDYQLRASLGTPTPIRCWLAASLDKTIRLHLEQPFGMDLF